MAGQKRQISAFFKFSKNNCKEKIRLANIQPSISMSNNQLSNRNQKKIKIIVATLI